MNGVSGVSFRETEKGLEVRVHKSKSSSSGKLKKRLPYNFKQLSRQISQAKTSDSARSLVSKMQAKLSWLYKKLKSGEYGEREVSAAIIHAASMERIAKRKVKHLEEEEAAENGAGAAGSAGEEEEIYGKDELKRKHRNSEEKQLTKADLRYLKALFDGLEQEKRQLASGGVSSAGGSDSSSFSCGIDCVPEVESMDMDVGDFVDVSV